MSKTREERREFWRQLIAHDASRIQVRINSQKGGTFAAAVPSSISVYSLVAFAIEHLGLRTAADVGSVEPMRVKWVLVDVNVEEEWLSLSYTRKLPIWAYSCRMKQPYECHDPSHPLGSLYAPSHAGFERGDEVVFRLYPVFDAEAFPHMKGKSSGC
jgi:hypothetical protein